MSHILYQCGRVHSLYTFPFHVNSEYKQIRTEPYSRVRCLV